MTRPTFMHCPTCGFPVVIHPVEAGSPRRCRQCRGEFVPILAVRGDAKSASSAAEKAARERISLRAQVRQKRRSLQ